KVGHGAVQFAGSTANAYTGLTTVNDGTLQFNKPAGVNDIPNNLVIGDGSGAAGSAVAQWLASNQVPDSANVTVQSDGKLDLQGFSETIANLTVNSGLVTTTTGGLTVTSLNMTGGTINLGQAASSLTFSGSTSPMVDAASDTGGNPAAIQGAGT